MVFGAEQRLEANNIQISGFAPTKTLVLADQDLVYQEMCIRDRLLGDVKISRVLTVWELPEDMYPIT